MSNDTELTGIEDLIDLIVGQARLDTHVALPCKVNTNNEDGTVNVTLGVKKVKFDKESFEIPPLSNIPILFSGNDTYSIHFPVAAGDEGLVIVCERDISKFKKTGEIESPAILRMHNLSDSVYIPLPISDSKRKIHDSSEGLVLEAGTTKIEVQTGGDVVITGNLITTGDITARQGPAQVGLATHLHPPDNTPPTPGT